jgi:dihydroorotate dehydrogenase electron transfer subunit
VPVAARQQFQATVRTNTQLCLEHYRLVIGLPDFPATAPGQFIQIACRELELDDNSPEVDWQSGQRPALHEPDFCSPHAFLRRPFSLAGRIDTRDGVELVIIHRVVGVGTDWLAQLQPGDGVNILGPLGNRFTVPPQDHTAILVGGGVGIPPMLYLADALNGRNTIAFCGAMSRELLALEIIGDADPTGMTPKKCVAEFDKSIISTDDGSYGFRGFVTQALEKYLDSRTTHDAPRAIFTCGPEPMMKRVAEIALARNIPCQIAVERAMACGMGTCQSCCIRVKKPDPKLPPLAGRDWCYRLACTDGPVFSAAELLW